MANEENPGLKSLPEIFVDLNATAPGKGTRAEPFVRLQDAFDLATDDTTVFIALGDYTSQGEASCAACPAMASWEGIKR